MTENNIEKKLYNQIKNKVFYLKRNNYNAEEIIRVCLTVNVQNLNNWLKKQANFSKFNWSDSSEKFKISCLGYADVYKSYNIKKISKDLNKIDKILSNSNIHSKYFGGLNFNKAITNDDKWKPFYSYFFFLPRFELIKTKNKTKILCNFLYSPKQHLSESLSKLQKDINSINFDCTQIRQPIIKPNILKEESFPPFKNWISKIDKAVTEINNKEIDKIVLARYKYIDLENSLNFWNITSILNRQNPKAITFGFNPKGSTFFIGSSPEILYSKKNSYISTHAVAGTRSRGENSDEDKEYENNLLNSLKDRKEHNFVLKYFNDSLDNLCSHLNKTGKISIIKFATLQHIHSEFNGILKKDITNNDILLKLHPSPAVGGAPQEESLNLLKKIECIDRGWYASPIGWISKDSAKFVVGIRSALHHKNSLYIYAGSGIVSESEPLKEWQETEIKIQNFIRALS
jgi:menaquinone-specific isochorismate synthase